MKAFIYLTLLTFGLAACSSEVNSGENGTEITETSTEGIAFFDGTWDEALAKAKSEGKLIFLDAYAEWCAPCRKMSRDEFTNEELGKYFNEHFINVKMDMEKGVGPKLATHFALDSYPTLYFIDCTGEPVSTNVGYHTANDLLALGKIYFDQVEPECK